MTAAVSGIFSLNFGNFRQIPNWKEFTDNPIGTIIPPEIYWRVSRYTNSTFTACQSTSSFILPFHWQCLPTRSKQTVTEKNYHYPLRNSSPVPPRAQQPGSIAVICLSGKDLTHGEDIVHGQDITSDRITTCGVLRLRTLMGKELRVASTFAYLLSWISNVLPGRLEGRERIQQRHSPTSDHKNSPFDTTHFRSQQDHSISSKIIPSGNEAVKHCSIPRHSIPLSASSLVWGSARKSATDYSWFPSSNWKRQKSRLHEFAVDQTHSIPCIIGRIAQLLDSRI